MSKRQPLMPLKDDESVNKPWRFFEASVPGLPPVVVTAPGILRALSRAFERLGQQAKTETLEDFRKVVTLRPCQQPARDGYEALRRQYKLDVRPGRRVRLSPRMLVKGDGYVVYPEGTATMVHVVLDNTSRPIRVKPDAIVAL